MCQKIYDEKLLNQCVNERCTQLIKQDQNLTMDNCLKQQNVQDYCFRKPFVDHCVAANSAKPTSSHILFGFISLFIFIAGTSFRKYQTTQDDLVEYELLV